MVSSERQKKPHEPAEDSFARLEAAINYQFKDRRLLSEAVTHTTGKKISPGVANNERLEFLGDRVLGLIIADRLISTFPEADEGGLAPRLNELVRKETLTEVAREIGLEDVIRTVQEDRLQGGQGGEAILADACEALIAAIYLDGGLEPATSFVDHYWLTRVTALETVPRDAKTALQEWAQARKWAPPVYTVVDRVGPDHNPCFEIEVAVGDLENCTGRGGSKRAAEQLAAEKLLRREKIWPAA